MSEEEKKAIEQIKQLIKFTEGVYIYGTENNSFKIVLKLIEKQQKEIETWKETENDYEHELARKDEEIKKQQKEIDFLQTKIKQNENIGKIKTCMTHNMPDNVEIVCMVREDFERNFGNYYISKDKIREIIKDLEDFDTKFYSIEELKLAIKNSLKELLGE